jgi:hypothetical protein
MAISYPVGVPFLTDRGSYSSSPVISVIRSNVDIGKPMVRARFTGELFNVNWRILMKGSELAILYNWYSENLDKNLNFEFPDPIFGTLKEYSFITPPEGSHIGGEFFLVDFKLRTIEGYVYTGPPADFAEWIPTDLLEWISGDYLEW